MWICWRGADPPCPWRSRRASRGGSTSGKSTQRHIVKTSLMSVSQAVLAYGERMVRLTVTAAELKAAEALLHKAAEVVEGPPPPPRKAAKCLYCQYRPICTST